ncbi:MAG: hypothetical protein GF405_00270 [Candidatus Eisenbacteria bacterium]|nr:hypothetical protein [Candidatus Eisenbacteria bacterium]
MITVRTGTALFVVMLMAAAAGARTITPSDTLVATVRATVEESRFGSSLAAGDLDGDGRIELVVGAPGLSSVGGAPLAGAVYVLSRPFPAVPDAPFVRSGSERDQFGAAVIVDDLTGDGLDDLIVSAPGASPRGRAAAGAVNIWFGPVDSPRDPDVTVEGALPGDRFGVALLVADVTNDTHADLIVAAPRGGSPDRVGFGTVSIIPGRTLAALSGPVGIADIAAATVRGDARGDALSAVTSGDLDGDGLLELIVGAPHADGDDYDFVDAGRVGVFTLEPDVSDTLLLSEGAALVDGPDARGFLGAALAAADLTGDGNDELIIGAPTGGSKRYGGLVSGQAYLLFGSEEGLPVRTKLAESDPTRFYSHRWQLLGAAVAAEDLDGDRTGDLVLGAPFLPCDGEETRCGGVFYYRGSLRSVVAAKAGSADRAEMVFLGELPDGGAGGALATADLNGDGGSELIVGAPEAASLDEGPRAGAVHVIDSAAFVR